MDRSLNSITKLPNDTTKSKKKKLKKRAHSIVSLGVSSDLLFSIPTLSSLFFSLMSYSYPLSIEEISGQPSLEQLIKRRTLFILYPLLSSPLSFSLSYSLLFVLRFSLSSLPHTLPLTPYSPLSSLMSCHSIFLFVLPSHTNPFENNPGCSFWGMLSTHILTIIYLLFTTPFRIFLHNCKLSTKLILLFYACLPSSR